MGYRLNIRGSSIWENLLRDTNIEITDTNGYFTSDSLDGVLDELHSNSGGIPWTIISSNSTASVENGYFVDTSTAAVTLTLPATAAIGDRVVLIDYAGTFGTNNCTIARNGHKIMGDTDDLVCDVSYLSIGLVYSDATQGWRISETFSSGPSSEGVTWLIVSSNTTATKNYGYFVDTSVAAVTLTLPATAAIGDSVTISDYDGTFATNNCTIGRNGHKIMKLEQDFICNVDDSTIKLTYADTSKGWRITES